jgi:hypothetical protein
VRVATFLVGFIVGASIVALATIVIAPSRRVRAEERMDSEDVTRILLGQDPDEPTTQTPIVDVTDHPRNYDTSELQALRNIGQRTGGRRRR